MAIPKRALSRAARRIEATYEVPFLAHAPMEPMNCVVQLSPGKCEVWNGEQLQTGSQAALAQFLGIKPEDVRINMLLAGGSFGRRGNFSGEYHVRSGGDREGRGPHPFRSNSCARAKTIRARATTARCTCTRSSRVSMRTIASSRGATALSASRSRRARRSR